MRAIRRDGFQPRPDLLSALTTGLLRGLSAMVPIAPRGDRLFGKPESLIRDLGLTEAEVERLDGAELERQRAWERLRHLR